jgi:hypothetical protein
VVNIRYTPSGPLRGESLVTFTESSDGAVSVRLRRLRQPLAAAVDAVVGDAANLTCDTIVQRLPLDDVMVDRERLARMQRLYRQLLATRISADASGDVYLDTSKFEYVVSGGMANLSLTLFPASKDGRRAHPMLRLLKEIVALSDDAHAARAAK